MMYTTKNFLVAIIDFFNAAWWSVFYFTFFALVSFFIFFICVAVWLHAISFSGLVFWRILLILNDYCPCFLKNMFEDVFQKIRYPGILGRIIQHRKVNLDDFMDLLTSNLLSLSRQLQEEGAYITPQLSERQQLNQKALKSHQAQRSRLFKERENAKNSS